MYPISTAVQLSTSLFEVFGASHSCTVLGKLAMETLVTRNFYSDNPLLCQKADFTESAAFITDFIVIYSANRLYSTASGESPSMKRLIPCVCPGKPSS